MGEETMFDLGPKLRQQSRSLYWAREAQIAAQMIQLRRTDPSRYKNLYKSKTEEILEKCAVLQPDNSICWKFGPLECSTVEEAAHLIATFQHAKEHFFNRRISPLFDNSETGPTLCPDSLPPEHPKLEQEAIGIYPEQIHCLVDWDFAQCKAQLKHDAAHCSPLAQAIISGLVDNKTDELKALEAQVSLDCYHIRTLEFMAMACHHPSVSIQLEKLANDSKARSKAIKVMGEILELPQKLTGNHNGSVTLSDLARYNYYFPQHAQSSQQSGISVEFPAPSEELLASPSDNAFVEYAANVWNQLTPSLAKHLGNVQTSWNDKIRVGNKTLNQLITELPANKSNRLRNEQLSAMIVLAGMMAGKEVQVLSPIDQDTPGEKAWIPMRPTGFTPAHFASTAKNAAKSAQKAAQESVRADREAKDARKNAKIASKRYINQKKAALTAQQVLKSCQSLAATPPETIPPEQQESVVIWKKGRKHTTPTPIDQVHRLVNNSLINTAQFDADAANKAKTEAEIEMNSKKRIADEAQKKADAAKAVAQTQKTEADKQEENAAIFRNLWGCFCNHWFPGSALASNTPTGPTVPHSLPNHFGIHLQDFDSVMARSPQSAWNAGAHQQDSQIDRYTTTAITSSLSALFGPTELRYKHLTSIPPIDRNTLTIVDGKTVYSRIQEEYLKIEGNRPPFSQWYKDCSKRLSNQIVTAALLAGRHVEVHIPDSDGNLPATPIQIHKDGWSLDGAPKVTLGRWERFFQKLGIRTKNVKQAEEMQALANAQKWVQASYTVARAEHFHTALQSNALFDSFFGAYMHAKGIPDRAAFNQLVPKSSPYRLDRSAVTACIFQMIGQHKIEDILDPNKLQHKKRQVAQEYMKHALMDPATSKEGANPDCRIGDTDWLASTFYLGYQSVLKTFINSTKNATEHEEANRSNLPTLRFIGQLLSDINHDISHSKQLKKAFQKIVYPSSSDIAAATLNKYLRVCETTNEFANRLFAREKARITLTSPLPTDNMARVLTDFAMANWETKQYHKSLDITSGNWLPNRATRKLLLDAVLYSPAIQNAAAYWNAKRARCEKDSPNVLSPSLDSLFEVEVEGYDSNICHSIQVTIKPELCKQLGMPKEMAKPNIKRTSRCM